MATKKKTTRKKSTFFSKIQRNSSVRAKKRKIADLKRKLKKAGSEYKATVKKVAKRISKKK